MRKKRIILAGIFILLGIILKFFLVGYSFSAYIMFAAAAAVLYFEVLKKYEKIEIYRKLKIFSIAFLIVFFLFFIITQAQIISASAGQYVKDADYLIVLGAGVNGTEPSLSLRNRLDAALGYMLQNPSTICIVSGGQGKGEDISEAECMYRYLTRKGISDDRIIKEEKAKTTQENVQYSLDIISSIGKTNYTVAVVSSEYHLFRAKLMFSDRGIEVGTIPGKTSYITLKINYFLREVPATWVFMLFR